MDESFIYERLKALSGGLEREGYRDISKAFEEVVRYNRQALRELETKLNEELRDISERFYLYGAVAAAGDTPSVNDFLCPMDEGSEPESMATVFCPCAKSRLRELFGQPHELEIQTDAGTVTRKARFAPCRRYQRRIGELRDVYYENGVYWRTPYLPYVDRFADVFCEEQGAGPEGEIRFIRMKDLDLPLSLGLVPLWNVEPVKLKCTVFPIPAIDERYFCHTLRLPFPQDGYVVRRERGIRNMYMSARGMEVITEERGQKEFALYRIAVRRDVKVPHYPLTSNMRRMRHIDRQADNAAGRLCTRAEIGRIASVYEASEGLKLVEIREDRQGSAEGEGGRYRFAPPGRERLCLAFRAEERGFLTEDQVSFLAEEVQGAFPQFAVTGEIV